MKKKFALLIVAIAFSVLFFACEEEGIAVPTPPPLPNAADDSTLFQNDTGSKKTSAKSKEKPAPAAKKETAKKEAKPAAKSASALCTAPCDTDSEQLSSGKYTIQIGVYPSESSAISLVRRMSGNGIRAYYAQVDNPAQLLGLYYRVRVGYFNGRAEAENFARARLEPLGYAWWVDQRKYDKFGGNGSGGGSTSTSTSFSSSKTPVDKDLETAKQAYREQLAREAAEAASLQQGTSTGTSTKRKKKTRNNSSSEFDWDD
jgi:hypothetical protein